MGEDREDEPPTTKAGAAAVRAAVRPEAATDPGRAARLPPGGRADPSTLPTPRRAKTTQQSALAMTECAACRVATPVARFCTECGATLVQRNFCSGCGAHLQPLANFCDACGLKVPV